ncbi:MAG: alkaline phosphatase family protein [Deltaproteobacteria bacterium]|nr:alkaline phosphatase family protein [Deltaproteobacteria bacterium]
MKRLFLSLAILLFWPVLVPAADKTIIVIVSLDGFGANRLSPELNQKVLRHYAQKDSRSFFQAPDLPFLRNLSQSPGVLYKRNGIAPVFPSITNTNHASLLTGKQPRDHRLVGNYFAEPVPGRGYKMVSFQASERKEFYEEIHPPEVILQNFNVGTVFWPSTSGPRTHDPRFSIPEIFLPDQVAPPFRSQQSLFFYHSSFSLEEYAQLLHGQSVVGPEASEVLCTERSLRPLILPLLSQIDSEKFYPQFIETVSRVKQNCPAVSPLPPRVALRFFLDLFNLRKGIESVERMIREGDKDHSLLFLHLITTDTAQHENRGVGFSFEMADRMLEKLNEVLDKTRNGNPLALILTADHGVAFMEKEIFLEKFLIESGMIAFNEKKGVGYLFDKTWDVAKKDRYYSFESPAYWSGVSGMHYSLRLKKPEEAANIVRLIRNGSFPGQKQLGDCYYWEKPARLDSQARQARLVAMSEKPVPEEVRSALPNPFTFETAPHIFCVPKDSHTFFAQAKKGMNGEWIEKTARGKGWHGYFADEKSPELRALFLTTFQGDDTFWKTCLKKGFSSVQTTREVVKKIEKEILSRCLESPGSPPAGVSR